MLQHLALCGPSHTNKPDICNFRFVVGTQKLTYHSLKGLEALVNSSLYFQPSEQGTYTANEVVKVVSAMKKVIERLQTENNNIKSAIKRHQKTSFEAENIMLKVWFANYNCFLGYIM